MFNKKLAIKLLFVLNLTLIPVLSSPSNAQQNNYVDRGLTHYELGEYKEAIDDYNTAIRIDSQDAWAYNLRGIAYEKLGEYKEAIDDYNTAIRINPQDSVVYNRRGNAYRKLGEYKKALEIDPQDELAKNNLRKLRNRL